MRAVVAGARTFTIEKGVKLPPINIGAAAKGVSRRPFVNLLLTLKDGESVVFGADDVPEALRALGNDILRRAGAFKYRTLDDGSIRVWRFARKPSLESA